MNDSNLKKNFQINRDKGTLILERFFSKMFNILSKRLFKKK